MLLVPNLPLPCAKYSAEPIALLGWPKDSDSPEFTALSTSGMKSESACSQNASGIGGKRMRWKCWELGRGRSGFESELGP